MKDNKSLLQPSSLVPPIRPELIKSLIDGVDRYNPDNVSILEEYQFNLHLVNDQVIVNILVKALTAIPNPDFNLCLYLLQESSLSDENISKLYDAQKLIEEGKYQEFWKMYETDESFKELTSEAVGFEDAIRKVIMKIISMAYQNISADLLREYLNYGSSPNDDESFKEFIKSQGLELAENNLVNIPTNIDNEAKPTVIRENIKFDRKIQRKLPILGKNCIFQEWSSIIKTSKILKILTKKDFAVLRKYSMNQYFNESMMLNADY
ncbi:7927_t:CDS:2 [Entrophospora sp. SA101]|nr:7927_t:CDS:2 [Entrophospora sp. SA101]